MIVDDGHGLPMQQAQPPLRQAMPVQSFVDDDAREPGGE
jgi:hypothetical protein